MNFLNHVHLISAGEKIHVTFPKAVNEFKMDKAIIVVENRVFEGDENPHYPKIRDSISEVKKIAELLDKSFEIKTIEQITLENVRDIVLEIFYENPDSQFYFNITGGTKVLSNGLFLMSIWTEGIAYHVGEFGDFQILSVPKMHLEDIQKNENYISILEVLSNTVNKELKQKDLFIKMKKIYKPSKSYMEKGNGNNELKIKLHRGTLSRWLQELEDWGLIKIYYVEGNKKEKIVKINQDGIFSLKFIKAMKARNN